MLNCTDVLCILHEHHYYHHHHQHHLQDHRQHHDHDHDHEPSHDSSHDHPHTVTDSEVSDVINGLLNSTDSELSSLSHLDAPSESVYMIFGVLIAMVLVALIIILLAVTISKLRKREDHNTTPSTAAPTDVVLHTTATNVTASPPPPPPPPTSTTTTATATTPAQPASEQNGFLGLWQYPPQYVITNNDKDTLVQPSVVERPKFGRGIRKNLSGRWKRLTKKKPVNEVYTIPADLRDQLKSIYVY